MNAAYEHPQLTDFRLSVNHDASSVRPLDWTKSQASAPEAAAFLSMKYRAMRYRKIALFIRESIPQLFSHLGLLTIIAQFYCR